jgi:predicted RNA-binding Zn-ribbon protein involved in translation (DUF1610 family)
MAAKVPNDVSPFMCPDCGSTHVRVVMPTTDRQTWATTDCFACGWPNWSPPWSPSWTDSDDE